MTIPQVKPTAPILSPGYIQNRFYGPTGTNATSDNVGIQIGLIQGSVFTCTEATTFNRIGINVTTADAIGSVRLGIYTFKKGVVGNLIAESGSLSVAATGDVEDTISAKLEAGSYYLAVQTDSAAVALFRFGLTAGEMPLLGQLDSDSVMSMPIPYMAQGYGPFPPVFGPMLMLEGNGNAYIWLRQV